MLIIRHNFPIGISNLECLHNLFTGHESVAGLLIDSSSLRRIFVLTGLVGSIHGVDKSLLVQILEFLFPLFFDEKLDQWSQYHPWQADQYTHLILQLLPNTDGLVMRPGYDKLPMVADRQSPDFAVVAIELLNVLELHDLFSSERNASEGKAYPITIPVLEHLVLPDRPEIMRVLFERNLHDTFLVSENRSMAVAKVEAPNLDILVGRASYDELGVRRYVHSQNGELGATKPA